MMQFDYRVGVVGGAGHIGLPLSLMLAQKGLRVAVIDKDSEKLKIIKEGVFPFMEEGGEELLQASKDFDIIYSNTYDVIAECDVIFLTVGTPIDEHLNPDLKTVFRSIEQIQSYLRDGQCLILRSTLFPGTSEKIYNKLKREGLDISVSFCPERIAQGLGLVELPEIPQIISGTDSRALEISRNIFSLLTKDILELSMTEAEVSKLFCNAWRYLQFAIANQFYIICEEKDLDFEKIRNAMMHHYSRMKNFPRSGFAAGPCLFKDTMQLAAYSRQSFSLGHNAMLINETLPDFLVGQAKKKTSLAGKKVGIIGMAFKPNNDDLRESLAYKLKRVLRYEDSIVYCTDPYVKDDRFVDLEEVLSQCEILFIGCPHDVYRSIRIRPDQELYDCWGMNLQRED